MHLRYGTAASWTDEVIDGTPIVDIKVVLKKSRRPQTLGDGLISSVAIR